MKKSLLKWQIAGFIFTGILGVLFHFMYEWTNQNTIIALFSPVNESIWEHNKLLFFPMLLFSLIQRQYIGKEYRGFWCVKLYGSLAAISLVPIVYYTVNGAFGLTPDWVNIAIFFLVVSLVYCVEWYQFSNDNIECQSPQKAFLLLCLIAVIFFVFTFITPQLPLFADPITNTYGI